MPGGGGGGLLPGTCRTGLDEGKRKHKRGKIDQTFDGPSPVSRGEGSACSGIGVRIRLLLAGRLQC